MIPQAGERTARKNVTAYMGPATMLKVVLVIKDTKARIVKIELTIVKMLPVIQQVIASLSTDLTNANVRKVITMQRQQLETALVS